MSKFDHRVFAARVARLKQLLGVTDSVLAARAGISVSALRNYMKGRSAPRRNMLTLMAQGWGVTVESLTDPHAMLEKGGEEREFSLTEKQRVLRELLSELESIPPQRGNNHDRAQSYQTAPLPLYGSIPAGPPCGADEAKEVYHVLTHLATENRYVLRVQGDSMTAGMSSLQDGDLVLIEHVETRDLEQFNNRVCVVLVDGENSIKRVQLKRAGSHAIVILKGDRPDYPTDTFLLTEREFEVQGIVLKIVDRDVS